MTLTTATVQAIIAAAFEAGAAQGIAVAATVLDRGGRVLASARSEAVGYVNLDVAAQEATAALNFGVPTATLLDMIKGDDLLMRSVFAQANLSLLPGGVDIRIGGELAGALGVSGGHYDQDRAIAERALAIAGTDGPC